ncbi:MAG TPA: chemotaxis protein CheW [Verrucomicrobiae bacterium]|nr:chemotaxis protein CheW [Verrucomicrobiae bacterium]
MDDIVKDFLIESNENLDRLDHELVQLEADPGSKELLASIFRTIHTIKGSCGFLGFARLEKVAHAGENLLSRLRDGQLVLTAERTSGLLATVDAVRRMLAEIQASEQDGENDYPELLETLKRLQAAEPGAPLPAPSPSPEKPKQEAAPLIPKDPPAPAAGKAASAEPAPPSPSPQPNPPAAEAASSRFRPSPGKLGGLLVERGQVTAEDLATALGHQESGDQRRVGEILVALGVCGQEDVQAAQQILETRGREAGVETVRVGVNLLDKLMNLVGELVLTRNQLLQFASSTGDTGFHTISQRMNLIASELQEEVMRTRMQPIGNIWNKFPRTVRDLALACGKEVHIEMEGRETELDRTIIEAIKDPLTHLVRNSIDHGIEPPAERVRAGKPSGGVLTMRAFHEGGQVNIEIADDGAGLNLQRIRAKAIERGLISAQQAGQMPEREIFNLIFLPGFSTAEKVTNVSGRGVGMDVVRTNLEKIGGAVDLQSVAGKGTTVRIKIPLTLAIIPALIVRCNGERFAIPQISLTELVRLESGKGIEMVHGAPVYRLRGQLLPLVYLNRILEAGAAAGPQPPGAGHHAEHLDFASAREKHARWLERLKDMLDGKATITVDEAGSARDCALGRWIYGEALREYGDRGEVRLLEQTHQQFHQLVREIVIAKVDGFEQRAREIFGGIEPLTRKIVELLTAVENKRTIELQNVNVVVLQADSHAFGVVVDDILDTEEIVVKPLGKQLKGISIYSGATIMGDGRVALILDVMGLAQRAYVMAAAKESSLADKTRAAAADRQTAEQQTWLLVQAGPSGRVALPLSVVARLEDLPVSAIEHAGPQEVLQYRGQVIPLIRLSDFLGCPPDAAGVSAGDRMHVVVYREAGRNIGLIVDRIVDIVEEHTQIENLKPREGVTGTCVIQQRTTDLLDVPTIVRAAHPGLFDAKAAGAEP